MPALIASDTRIARAPSRVKMPAANPCLVSLAMANTSGVGGKPISGVTYVIVALGVLMFLIYLYKKVSSVSIEVN